MPRQKINHLITFVSGIIVILGIALLIPHFSRTSESGNQVLWGLSLARLLVGVAFIILVSAAAVVEILHVTRPARWQTVMDQFLSSEKGLYNFLTILYGVALISGGALLLNIFPVAKHAEIFIGIISQLIYLIFWIFITSMLLIFLVTTQYKEILGRNSFFSPIRRILWFWMFLLIYILLVMYYRDAAYVSSLKNFVGTLLNLGSFFTAWALVSSFAMGTSYKKNLDRFMLLMGIFLTVLVLYGHAAAWVDWVHKSKYEYWDALARQFVTGKLYLADGSIKNFTIHDLTLHNGKWYVPVPPLPAILLMPVMLFVKPEDIFMGDVSIFFSALNAVLLFLILEQFINRQWIKISQGAALWIVLLFSFGTNHLWVGIMGEVWFVSQIVTVTFLALAILAALKGWSPVWIGLFLGLAMSARPNSLMTWPFVFAISMQIFQEGGAQINIQKMLTWAIKSAVPIGLAIGGLLLYNYARFDNILDFGYVSINGEPTIVRNAQTYGLFSFHYILHNLQVMLLYVPKIQWGTKWGLIPVTEGMSIFLSTPALIYLFRRHETQWWILGAWAAIFCNFALLVMYHNTGSAQFGYRYILDSIIPIMALIALTLQKRIPWHFIVLLMCSIAINIYGLAWLVNEN